MDSMQRCGSTFRAVRIKRGWRQVDLARRAGVHRSVISSIERGHHAGLHEAVARWFDTELPEWILAPEVSYSINGERGVIDILA
jgi:transcriptional regulator with XRE-family HTH domain